MTRTEAIEALRRVRDLKPTWSARVRDLDAVLAFLESLPVGTRAIVCKACRRAVPVDEIHRCVPSESVSPTPEPAGNPSGSPDPKTQERPEPVASGEQGHDVDPNDPTGGLHSTHDYDPNTRSFTPKRDPAPTPEPGAIRYGNYIIPASHPLAEFVKAGQREAEREYRKRITDPAPSAERCACGHFNFTHREYPLGASGGRVKRYGECRFHGGCPCPEFRPSPGQEVEKGRDSSVAERSGSLLGAGSQPDCGGSIPPPVSEPLTPADVNRWLAEHVDLNGFCKICIEEDDDHVHFCSMEWPCPVVRLGRDWLRMREVLKAVITSPPSEMSWRGKLVPINSTGMREVIDECARLERELAEARPPEREVGQ